MHNLIVITKHCARWNHAHPRKKTFNVDLWVSNTGRERDGYMSVSKACGVGIRAAKKEAKEQSIRYNAEIVDKTTEKN